ncbi:MAG: DUF1844 domain-containing protein [Lentisphaerae bacterium]|nr:DUF1844 domain-containing protein [Lentisphaerota bacterium]
MSDRSDLDRDISPFEQLVMMLATSAMQQLGKLVHPQTGRAETDLAGAGWTIDLLGMLEEKTRGNLDAHETRTIGEALTTLRLNFVDAANAAPADPPASAGTPGTAAPDGAPAAGDVEAPPPGPKGDDDGKRYHKTYG